MSCCWFLSHAFQKKTNNNLICIYYFFVINGHPFAFVSLKKRPNWWHREYRCQASKHSCHFPLDNRCITVKHYEMYNYTLMKRIVNLMLMLHVFSLHWKWLKIYLPLFFYLLLFCQTRKMLNLCHIVTSQMAHVKEYFTGPQPLDLNCRN